MPELKTGTYILDQEEGEEELDIAIKITHIDHAGGGFGGMYQHDNSIIGKVLGHLAKGENQYWSIKTGDKYSIRFNYRDFGTPEGETQQDQRNYGYFVSWVGYFMLENDAFDVLHLAGVEAYVPDPTAGGTETIRSLGEHTFTRQKP